MMTRTRLKLACAGFIVCVILAVLKNWLKGIDLGFVGLAVLNIGGYVWGETKRPSNGNGGQK